MSWDDFRESYRTIKLSTMKDRGAKEAELRLDLAERIIRPKTLRDMADVLDRLQADLLHGKCGRYKIEVNRKKVQRPRSPATVRSTMRTVIAALNWTTKKPRQWLDNVPRIDLMRVDVSDEMKGQPLVGEELDRYYAAIPKIVTEKYAAQWLFFAQAVVASGLRLSELMIITWDKSHTIRPVFRERCVAGDFHSRSPAEKLQTRNDSHDSVVGRVAGDGTRERPHRLRLRSALPAPSPSSHRGIAWGKILTEDRSQSGDYRR